MLDGLSSLPGSSVSQRVQAGIRSVIEQHLERADTPSDNWVARERGRRQSLIGMLGTESPEMRLAIVETLSRDFIDSKVSGERAFDELEKDFLTAFEDVALACEVSAFYFAIGCTSYEMHECTATLFSRALTTAECSNLPETRAAALRFLGARKWEKCWFSPMFSGHSTKIMPIVKHQLRSRFFIERTAAIDCWLSICSANRKHFDLLDFECVVGCLESPLATF